MYSFVTKIDCMYFIVVLHVFYKLFHFLFSDMGPTQFDEDDT